MVARRSGRTVDRILNEILVEIVFVFWAIEYDMVSVCGIAG